MWMLKYRQRTGAVQSRWSEAQNHYESLAACVRAILAGAGSERSYEEILAALGLGAITVAVADEGLGSWCTWARDAALLQTAPLYGLRLRELHPPEVAAGLPGAAEFTQHFRDSYVPLIRQALAHGQLALAWRGWPPPRERLWGLITAVHGDMLTGYTLWHEAQPLPLTGPAYQVYVVEECAPPPADALTPDLLFQHVARLAVRAWSGTWTALETLSTGAAAYRAWQDALRKAKPTDPNGLPLSRQQSHAARAHTAARTSLATWLRQIAPGLGGDHAAAAAQWAATAAHVSRTLQPYTAPESVEELLRQPAGIERICRALEDACQAEAALAQRLAALVGPVRVTSHATGA